MEQGLDIELDGLLGSGLLAAFRVTLVDRGKTMWLEDMPRESPGGEMPPAEAGPGEGMPGEGMPGPGQLQLEGEAPGNVLTPPAATPPPPPAR